MQLQSAILSDDDLAVREAYEQAQLRVVKRLGAPLPDPLSPVLISVVRDERDAAPDFLRHYRTAGVERFVFIDNGSADGTREYLAKQPDVDLFSVSEPFNWRRKQGWINRAIDFYGIDRWYIYADADEHIVFDGLGEYALSDLTGLLEQYGQTRARGFLLDMYSDLPVLLGASGDDLRLAETYPFFDPAGYRESRTSHLVSRLGGPRMRMFAKADPGFKPELTKYPLFRLRAGEFMANPHHIWPCAPNFQGPCILALLHFKFHGDLAGRIARAMAEASYWEASREYRAYFDVLGGKPDLSLHYEGSRRYESPRDLVESGLIDAIEWPPLSGEEGLKQVVRRSARRRRAERLSELGAPIGVEAL